MRGHQPSRGCRRARSTPGTRFVELRFPPPAARFFPLRKLLLPPLGPVELLQLIVRARASINFAGCSFRRSGISGLIAHPVAVVDCRVIEASRIGAHAGPSIAKSLPDSVFSASPRENRFTRRRGDPYAVWGNAAAGMVMPFRIISVRRSAETGRLSRYP